MRHPHKHARANFVKRVNRWTRKYHRKYNQFFDKVGQLTRNEAKDLGLEWYWDMAKVRNCNWNIKLGIGKTIANQSRNNRVVYIDDLR